jgi:hypothetical protein
MPISAAFPFASHYVNVEGSRIHYIEQGSGDPILFFYRTECGVESDTVITTHH